MKRYFNVIPGETSHCILLYGEIGTWAECKPEEILSEISEIAESGKHLDIRINSNGGDVYAGLAIYQAFKQTTIPMSIYIDGVAASIASIIALCGKPLYMGKYAKLMIHAISGGWFGSKAELNSIIEEYEVLENMLSDAISKKTGKTVEDIKAEYFDGTDHWLTAQQALDLGLINGIYNTDPVADSDPKEIYKVFMNRLSEPTKQDDMNFQELRKRPAFANCATDDEVMQRISEMEANADKSATLEAELQSYKEKEQLAIEADIKSTLDKAETEGRINAQSRPTFENILKKDLDAGKAAIQAIPAKKRVMKNFLDDSGETKQSAWDKRQQEIREKNK